MKTFDFNQSPTKEEIQQATESITVARVSLLFSQPFFGNIATRLILKPVDPVKDWDLQTAATDGRHLYFNPKFINALKPKEVIFLVGHELLHAIYEHVGGIESRLGQRDSKLWNVAADFAVNRDLIEFHIGEKITTVPCLYDKKYDGLSVEEIYESLLSQSTIIDISDLANQLLDEHFDNSENNDNKNKNGNRPTPSESELQEIRDEMRAAVLSAAQASGNVPASIKRMIDSLTEPQINWRELLSQQIESQLKNDYTYAIPNRRRWHHDVIFPSLMKEPAVECALLIDVSGSIDSEKIKTFVSEIQGMMQQYASYNISVICWDTKIHNVQVFTEDDQIESLLDFQTTGGGGTDPTCCWDYMKENEINPKQIVVFTDGEMSEWGDPDYAPTLWLIDNTNKNIKAPFGTTVYFE